MKNHNQYNAGIPDVWYSGLERDLWVEYKFIALPKRNDTIITIGLSALQVIWITKRREEGRNVGIIVGCAAGGVGFDGITDSKLPITTADFKNHIKSRVELANEIERFVNGPRTTKP